MSEQPKKPLSSVKAALLGNKRWADKDDMALALAEPIAVIGSACRLPGGITNARQYWDLLANGIDAIEEIPLERWDGEAWYDPDPSAPGKSTTMFGGFLKDVDKFDPKAFGIAPREALYMDPQQRLLLEVSWEAFEDSGNPLSSLRGSKTGVFFGMCDSDYGRMQLSCPDKISAHTLSGTARSIATGSHIRAIPDRVLHTRLELAVRGT
ncbi:MAG: polyketide synthase, partial [Pseudomonadota bacterium]